MALVKCLSVAEQQTHEGYQGLCLVWGASGNPFLTISQMAEQGIKCCEADQLDEDPKERTSTNAGKCKPVEVEDGDGKPAELKSTKAGKCKADVVKGSSDEPVAVPEPKAKKAKLFQKPLVKQVNMHEAANKAKKARLVKEPKLKAWVSDNDNANENRPVEDNNAGAGPSDEGQHHWGAHVVALVPPAAATAMADPAVLSAPSQLPTSSGTQGFPLSLPLQGLPGMNLEVIIATTVQSQVEQQVQQMMQRQQECQSQCTYVATITVTLTGALDVQRQIEEILMGRQEESGDWRYGQKVTGVFK
ncbi:hypothetical protein M422DRAFT_49511 [Sphaerobolus stellatus SS14]|uniref:Uncharacterized protein n=1 Tax=Sphaerobolus stellatus (strain SS14) TaxID=990650 RepID=A0A0C9UY54_SPHS4|nr:hypothetical protein M422DRAFT_49511 [Sphaerobolus stellatus SS14]